MKNKSWGQPFKWVFLLLILGFVSGCVNIPVPKPDLTNPIRTVAILPFANESNNIDAPKQIRDLLRKKLQAKFYKVLPLEDVDQVLLDELGITLGEQLSEVELADLKAKVTADAFIYGNITHYDQTMAGVINTNRVRAEMNMLQISNDMDFWKSGIGIKSESRSGGVFGSLASLASAVSDNSGDDPIQWITIESKKGGDGSIMGNLLSGLVDKAVSGAMGVTLTEESLALINRSTSTLRNGPGF